MDARDVIRNVVLRMRSEKQGGFHGYRGNGKWDFVSTGLPQVTPEELNVLCEFAGVVPDRIIPLGPCKTCKFAVNGQERGYEAPCGACSRPKHSNYRPARAVKQGSGA